MALQTIPHTFPYSNPKNFVVVPRREYRTFLQWRKTVKVLLNESWFWTSEWQGKEKKADEDIQKGRVSRSFSDVKSLIRDLNGSKSK